MQEVQYTKQSVSLTVMVKNHFRNFGKADFPGSQVCTSGKFASLEDVDSSNKRRKFASAAACAICHF